jgi:hypothetical protein
LSRKGFLLFTGTKGAGPFIRGNFRFYAGELAMKMQKLAAFS